MENETVVAKFEIDRSILAPVQYVALVTTITTQHGHLVAATDVYGPFDDEWAARKLGASQAEYATRGSSAEFGGTQSTYSVSRLTPVSEVRA